MSLEQGESMNAYRFVDGVYFVRGTKGATICDTNTTNIYWINPAGVEAIESHNSQSYWEELRLLGLVEEASQWDPFPSIPRASRPGLSFVWFEIMTSDCNESCVHCYADSMPPTKRLEMGLEVIPDENPRCKLSYLEWCGLIDEAYALGARRCQFIGGEPMLYKDNGKTCLDLAEYTQRVGFTSIEIYPNATLLTEAKVRRIKALRLRIAVSLYSDDPAVHDSITQTQGSHAKTMRALDLLRKHEVQTRVETVVMRQNQHTVKQTIELVDSMGFAHKHPDPIRPRGRGDKITLFPSLETVGNHYFSSVSCPSCHYGALQLVA